MTDAEGPQILEPVHAADGEADGKQWSYRLVVFLRVMAGISLLKGLYHWAIICGIGAPFPSGFDSYSTPYQVATVFFAIIDLSWREWDCGWPRRGARWCGSPP